MPPPTAGWSDRGRARAGAGAASSEPDPFARIVDGDNVAVAMPAGAVNVGTGVSSWSASSPRAPRRESLYRTLAFRRTIIPILLTLGVSLPALAGGWLMLDPDSTLKSAPQLAGPLVPVTLVVVGVILLILAVLNMLYVRHELQRAASG